MWFIERDYAKTWTWSDFYDDYTYAGEQMSWRFRIGRWHGRWHH